MANTLKWHFLGKRGAEQTILALHGFTGSGLDFEQLADRLGDSVEILAPDLPGHGESHFDDYSLEALFTEINAFLDNNFPQKRITLLGYSMGGRLALHYARANGDRLERLILISANPGISDGHDRQHRYSLDFLHAERLRRNGTRDFMDYWRSTPLIATQENVPEPYKSRMLTRRYNQEPVALAMALEGYSPGSLLPLWEKLGEITCPVKCIAGELDLEYVEIAKEMAALLPHGGVEIVSRVGHAPHLEDAGAVLHAFNDSYNKSTC